MSTGDWIRRVTAEEAAAAERSPAPDGYELWWHVASDDWQPLAVVSLRRCRFTVGPKHKQCRAPAAVTLDRSRGRGRPNLWAYCEEHLYGRKLEDGRVLEMRLRAKELLTG